MKRVMTSYKSSSFKPPTFSLHKTDESSISLLRSDEFTTIRESIEHDNSPDSEEEDEEGDALEPKDYTPVETEDDNKYVDSVFEIATFSSGKDIASLTIPPPEGNVRPSRPDWVKTIMTFSGIRLWLICICFWICSVGTFFPWFSLNATIFYWSPIYGPEILLYMTTCYSLPGFFVQLLQAKYDLKINHRFGKVVAFRFRMVMISLVLISIIVSVPFLPNNIYLFCFLVVIIGVASSTGYGTLFQLVTLFPKMATSFLSLGYASPGLLLLLLTRAIFGDDHPEVTNFRFYLLFGITAGIVVVGLIGFLVLLWSSAEHLRESKVTHPSLFQEANNIQEEDIIHLPEPQVDNKKLVKKIWMSGLGISLLLVSRVTVFTILTHVPTQWDNSDSSLFSQRLVFINLGGDLVGRLLTIIIPKLPEKRVPLIILCIALLQFSFLNVVLLYVYGDHIIPLNDLVVEIVLGVFATITGCLQTLSYTYVALQVKVTQRTQVGALMNLFTQFGNWFGLGLSFSLKLFFSG